LAGYLGLHGSRLRLLQHEDNAVYLVTAGSGERFVLRMSATSGWSEAELRSEVAWQAALAADRLPVPEPVADRRGETIVVVEGMPCVLLRWRPGRVWRARGPSVRQMALAGELSASAPGPRERDACL
jgi:Ser/Thr protein kinase RdoA (MazF antagonist)